MVPGRLSGGRRGPPGGGVGQLKIRGPRSDPTLIQQNEPRFLDQKKKKKMLITRRMSALSKWELITKPEPFSQFLKLNTSMRVVSLR